MSPAPACLSFPPINRATITTMRPHAHHTPVAPPRHQIFSLSTQRTHADAATRHDRPDGLTGRPPASPRRAIC
ncbi:MAG: hypothetical protein ACOX5Z_08115 [Desulfobulbus sp.]|jgi:hypothetical protein